MAEQPFDLAKIKERCDKATEGPWKQDVLTGLNIYGPNRGGPICQEVTRGNDAIFIVDARTSLPACVAEIERRGRLIEEQTKEIVKLRNLSAATLRGQAEAKEKLLAHLLEVEWIETPAPAGFGVPDC